MSQRRCCFTRHGTYNLKSSFCLAQLHRGNDHCYIKSAARDPVQLTCMILQHTVLWVEAMQRTCPAKGCWSVSTETRAQSNLCTLLCNLGNMFHTDLNIAMACNAHGLAADRSRLRLTVLLCMLASCRCRCWTAMRASCMIDYGAHTMRCSPSSGWAACFPSWQSCPACLLLVASAT